MFLVLLELQFYSFDTECGIFMGTGDRVLASNKNSILEGLFILIIIEIKDL